MYCPHCNAYNDDRSTYCSGCGMQLSAPEPMPQPAPQPVVEPAPEPVPQPTPEQVPQQAAEPAPQPVAEQAPEQAAEPAPQPAPEPMPQQPPYQAPQNYQQPPVQDPYRQSWDPQPQQYAPQGTPPSNVLPIVSIVVSVLFGNLIALVLAILSLVSFNNYDAAMRRNDVLGAQANAEKSRKLAIAAIVLAAVGLVLAIIEFVAIVVFGLVSFSGSGVPDLPFDADMFSAIATLIH